MSSEKDGGSSYEFTPQQNDSIVALAAEMFKLSLVILGFAVFVAVAAFRSGASLQTVALVLHLIVIAVLFTIAWYTWRVSRIFSNITKTQGNDISHLMEALASIRVLYSIQVALFGLILVLSAIGLFL